MLLRDCIIEGLAGFRFLLRVLFVFSVSKELGI